MKKLFITLLASTLLLTSCTTSEQFFGTATGASLGGMFGSAIGGITGGRRGHNAGALAGMVIGGVIGAAATAPDKDKEILVVSFGTSFNDSRVATIGAVEKAIQAAYPDWAVRRAFTAQIIINHIAARDGEQINTVQQALDNAVEAGVKQLVVAPTHLMHGAEYDELTEALAPYEDKMTIVVSEPLLGEVGADATVINADKKAVAEAAVAAAVKDAGFASIDEAAEAGTAFVFMGHGTSHTANVTYDQMQTVMDELGYKNVFIGTVEGEPEDTECSVVIGKVKDAGYKNVVLRPLMVVAGDHANNDMADPEDPESWLSQFTASGAFDKVDCQINGLGEIVAVQDVYVAHVAKAIEGIA